MNRERRVDEGMIDREGMHILCAYCRSRGLTLSLQGHQAGELGCGLAYYNLAVAYEEGRGGVEINEKKAQHYYELAAMNGSVMARHNLGVDAEKLVM